MKPYLLLMFISAVAIVGCKKYTPSPDSPANGNSSTSTSTTQANSSLTSKILGKWNLVKDTTSSVVQSVSKQTGTFIWYITTKLYAGQAEDYFDFRADGFVYIRENGISDTMSYKMTTDTTVVFGKSGGYYIAESGTSTAIPTPPNVINPFTDHSACINYTFGVGPAGSGPLSRAVYLQR
jgi:hypothetical protein